MPSSIRISPSSAAWLSRSESAYYHGDITMTACLSIVTSVAAAGVAITALLLDHQRFALLERRLDRIETKLAAIERGVNQAYCSLSGLLK